MDVFQKQRQRLLDRITESCESLQTTMLTLEIRCSYHVLESVKSSLLIAYNLGRIDAVDESRRRLIQSVYPVRGTDG